MGGASQSKIADKSYKKVKEGERKSIGEDETSDSKRSKRGSSKGEISLTDLKKGVLKKIQKNYNLSGAHSKNKVYLYGKKEAFLFKINENHIFDEIEKQEDYIPYVEKDKIFGRMEEVDYNLLFEKKKDDDNTNSVLFRRHMITYLHSFHKGKEMKENIFPLSISSIFHEKNYLKQSKTEYIRGNEIFPDEVIKKYEPYYKKRNNSEEDIKIWDEDFKEENHYIYIEERFEILSECKFKDFDSTRGAKSPKKLQRLDVFPSLQKELSNRSERDFDENQAQLLTNFSLGSINFNQKYSSNVLMYAVLALSRNPQILRRIIPYFNKPEKILHPIILFECGPFIKMNLRSFPYSELEEFFPFVEPNPTLQWLALLEKSFMSIYGSYLKGICSDEIPDIFLLLTGVPSLELNIKNEVYRFLWSKDNVGTKEYEKKADEIFGIVEKYFEKSSLGILGKRHSRMTKKGKVYMSWDEVEKCIDTGEFSSLQSYFYEHESGYYIILGVKEINGVKMFKIYLFDEEENFPKKYSKDNKSFWKSKMGSELSQDLQKNEHIAYVDANMLTIISSQLIFPQINQKEIISYKQISVIYSKLIIMPFTIEKSAEYLASFIVCKARSKKFYTNNSLTFSIFQVKQDSKSQSGYSYKLKMDSYNPGKKLYAFSKGFLAKGNYIAIITNDKANINNTGCATFQGPGNVEISFLNTAEKSIFDMGKQILEDIATQVEKHASDSDYETAYYDYSEKKASMILTKDQYNKGSKEIIVQYYEAEICNGIFGLFVKNICKEKIFGAIQYRFEKDFKEIEEISFLVSSRKSIRKFLRQKEIFEVDPKEKTLCGIFYYNYLDENIHEKYHQEWVKFYFSKNVDCLKI